MSESGRSEASETAGPGGEPAPARRPRLWTWDDGGLPGKPPAPAGGAAGGDGDAPPRRPDSGGRALAAARAAGPIVTDRIDPEALPAPPPAGPPDVWVAGGDAGADAPTDGEPLPSGVSRWGRTWAGNLTVERYLATGMFACVAWSLTRALSAGGMRASQTISLFLLATLFFGAGAALGGRRDGRNYRKYTDYGLTDWVLLLIPLLLLVRLLPSVLEGPGALARDVSGWVRDPISFWDAALAWGIILLFFVWDAALSVAQSLGTLAFQPAEASARADAANPALTSWETSPYRFADHAAAWRHLMRLFIFGGCLVLMFTGLSLVHPEDLGNPERPEVAGVIPVVLIYFLLGLILASQTSLDRLRAGWLRGGVAVQPGLARRWLGYSVALMALGLGLALLLPTSFSDETADQIPLIWRWLWFIRLPLTFVLRLMEWLIGGLA
ncbi:MAG TPA: hypothetical protein VNK05_09095, partial [Chloroflexota bacterium]|nr:hypothetical protein [Chloroflexota bacterium]